MTSNHHEQDLSTLKATALTTDPVIAWLEQIRDFTGSTSPSRDLAQRTIDRLRPPTIDPWTIVASLVDELGELGVGAGGALISDRRNNPAASAADAWYYGGYLVAESVTRRNAVAFSFLPQLLVAARENPHGRKILQQLAAALQAPAPISEKVRDRLDGTVRLARLAREFQFAGARLDETDPFYAVSVILNHVAEGFLQGNVDAAAQDITAWLERKRANQHAERMGRNVNPVEPIAEEH